MSSLEPPPMADIEAALDALLRLAIKDDATHDEAPTATLTATPFRLDRIPTRLEFDARSLARQPIGTACRQAVRRLGQHLFDRLGSTDALRDVLERVAELTPADYGRRVAIMDHAWDGVGRQGDRWIC